MTRTALLALLLLLTFPVLAQQVTSERLLPGDFLPVAVWTGESFAVFWYEQGSLVAANIGLDGVFDGQAVPIATAESPASVAFDGRTLLLLTNRPFGGINSIVARRLTPEFAPIGGGNVLAEGGSAGVVWNGSEFFAKWVTQMPLQIAIAKLRDGEVVARRVITSVPTPRPFQVSFDATSTDLLVAWSDAVGCEQPSVFPCIAGSRIRATRLDTKLELLDPAGVTIADAYYPQVVSNGREYLLAWDDLLASSVQRVHPTGVFLGDRIVVDPLKGFSLGLTAAWDGHSYFVVMRDSDWLATNGIYGARVDASGAQRSFPIDAGGSYYFGPIVFPGPPAHFLVAYQQFDGSVVHTYYRVVDLDTPARRRSIQR